MWVQSTGGLGNQLFQWTFAHHVRELYPNRKIGVFNDRFHDSNRVNHLHAITGFCKHQISTKRRDTYGNLFRIIDKFSLRTLPARLGVLTYETGEVELGKFWLARGFFQTPELFENAVKATAKELSTLIAIEDTVIPPEPYQVIHLRRGDYLLNPDTYGTLDRNYYQRNLDPELNLLIVGDEIELPKEFDNLRANQIYLGPRDMNEFETLSIMEHATRLVLANSTFSWWGGVLASMNGALVIAPNPWQPRGGEWNLRTKSLDWIYSDSQFE